MPVVERTITVDQSPETVWRFLADFTTTEEWDPPTVSTERISGDGGVGTTYHSVAKFRGRRTEVDYVVTDYVEGRRLRLRGDATGLEVVDTFTLEPTPAGGSQVTYEARFRRRVGPAPVDLPSMRRLGDFVAESLQESLEHLSA
ncbi:SRPBCC family protein [Nocardioides rubriscoriae]|uniref:SRPBCC family protein n=1 Tax=Nocardioides rubriscoriae TaxID=642762 RepID=UPI0011E043F1|nr:SRPBCC family protein [Nocardioides rubriscoriae]